MNIQEIIDKTYYRTKNYGGTKQEVFELLSKCGGDEESVVEYFKCKSNSVYFIKKYIKVIHPKRGLVDFDLYPFQEKIARDLKNHRFNILRKFRQAGCTTLASAETIHTAIFTPYSQVAIVSMGEVEAVEVLERIKVMYRELPAFLKILCHPRGDLNTYLNPTSSKDIETYQDEYGIEDDNKKTLKLYNHSIIKSRPAGKQSGRSISGSLLIFDEAAFIEKIDTLWAAVYPIISCVSKDTLILTDKGYRKIGDYFLDKNPGDYFNLDLSVYGQEGVEKVTQGYVSPNNETKIIKTRRGIELEASIGHPLYKLDYYSEMVPVEDLKVGDYLKVASNTNIFGDESLSEDIAYMLGGYIAEGWITQNNAVYICNTDKEFREIYLRNKFSPLSSRPDKLRRGSKNFVEELISYGINPEYKCYNKEIPKKIFYSNKETQKYFLMGLFDGDGHISKNGEIIYTSTSKILCQQLQLLLLNLGIISSIKKINKEKIMNWSKNKLLPQGTKLKNAKDCYKLSISRGYTTLFKETIGFKIKRKVDRLNSSCKKNLQSVKSIYIPKIYIQDTLQNFFKNSSKSLYWFRTHGIRSEKILDNRINRKITLNSLIKLKDLVKSHLPNEYTNYYSFFEQFNDTWFYDEIVEIKNSNNQTVDFTVPRTRSFIQNNILGSNTGGRVFALSTVNGVGNWFHIQWEKAVEKLSTFNPIQINWKDHPEYKRQVGYEWLYEEMENYDPPVYIDEWEATTKGNISVREWLQEYESVFLGTGDTYIDGEILTQIREKVLTINPLYTKYNNRLRIYKEPYPAYDYILAADTSLGRGFDYSAFHIINIYNGEQVAEFYSNRTPIDEFAKIINTEAKLYNLAYVIPERNIIGNNLIEWLFKIYEYENIWSDSNGDMGMLTTVTSKEILLAGLEEAVRNKQIQINSDRTVKELLSFIIKENGKAEADEGNHDDLVISLAIAVYGLNSITERTPIETQKSELLKDTILLPQSSKYSISMYGDTVEEDLSWLINR